MDWDWYFSSSSTAPLTKKSSSNNTEEIKTSCSQESQTHDHEFEGSTKLAEQGNDRHNHRFAGVTSRFHTA